MKKFKEGEYYIFDANKKRTGKAKIHGFVEINGTKYAVVSYRDDNDVPYIKTLPVCELNGRAAIFLLDAVFIYVFADAPVLPKVVKFKVGETYIDDKFALLTVTAKYTDSIGATYIVLGNKYIAAVHEIDVYGDVVEYANFLNLEKGLIRKVFANKTFGD